MRTRAIALLVFGVAVGGTASAQRGEDMRRVGPATYHPFYPASAAETELPMPAFLIDRVAVTNARYLAFVSHDPSWQRGQVSRLFADEGYLNEWQSPTQLGPNLNPEAPVVNVSWFAAKAYCHSRGARLPSEAEWELTATAGEQTADSRNEPAWRQRILAWYAAPSAHLPAVGSTPPNFWGVQDLHGVVWEWVLDFNSTLVSSDARENGDKDKLRFCGAGSLAADDKTDYPSFMRIAMRSSLRADYTTKNLGFRCARSLPKKPEAAKKTGSKP
jgi:formylglycine-generating enzyme required for sulfatase activity